MRELTQTRPRGSRVQRNRRLGGARADARNPRMRMSSDSVVSAYIRELANGAPPATVGRGGGGGEGRPVRDVITARQMRS
jgi:hypothetical protein